MQINFRMMPILAFTVLATFSACTKQDKENNEPPTELSTHNDDQAQVSAEIDAVTDDANLIMENNTAFRTSNSTICDATVAVDTMSDPKTITINYNGSTCSGTHTRSGVVVLSMAKGMYWKDAGAVMNVSYQNLRITRTRDQKSITINGSHTLTNVSGGRLVELATRANVVHDIHSSGMTIKFTDSTTRSWQVARRRTYTYNNGIVITFTGRHTDGNQTGITEWGTNRFGKPFSTAITQPLVVRQDCNFRITAGELVHTQPLITATVTYGLDANGNPTACPGTGHYYSRITWVADNGRSLHYIFPY